MAAQLNPGPNWYSNLLRLFAEQNVTLTADYQRHHQSPAYNADRGPGLGSSQDACTANSDKRPRS